MDTEENSTTQDVILTSLSSNKNPLIKDKGFGSPFKGSQRKMTEDVEVLTQRLSKETILKAYHMKRQSKIKLFFFIICYNFYREIDLRRGLSR